MFNFVLIMFSSMNFIQCWRLSLMFDRIDYSAGARTHYLPYRAQSELMSAESAQRRAQRVSE